MDVFEPQTANAFTDPDLTCPCVSDHNPNVIMFERHHIWPLGWGGPDEEWNTVYLCPTAHGSVHHLLREARKAVVHPDELPWEMRKRFSPFIRDLAGQGWDYAAQHGAV